MEKEDAVIGTNASDVITHEIPFGGLQAKGLEDPASERGAVAKKVVGDAKGLQQGRTASDQGSKKTVRKPRKSKAVVEKVSPSKNTSSTRGQGPTVQEGILASSGDVSGNATHRTTWGI